MLHFLKPLRTSMSSLEVGGGVERPRVGIEFALPRMMRTHFLNEAAVVLAASVLMSACTGQLLSPSSATKTPIDKAIAGACGANTASGHAMIHRLSNIEYNNTIRDLLYTNATPGDLFASSSVGAGGFANESDVLTVSDQIVTEYAHAAETLADAVLASKGQPGAAWGALTGCAATVASPSADCVKSVVLGFAERAFRRPVDADDLERLMTVYVAGGSFAQGFHDVVVATLVDPLFLFSYIKHPSPDDPKVMVALNDYELASRLSYALWQSMPDDTLRALAAAGQLKDAATMQTQIVRMLKDGKAVSLATAFRHDWAALSLLDGSGGYGGLPSSFTDQLRQETQLFIEDAFMNDQSILSLVTGKETFVNKEVAAYYGWNVPTAISSDFVKVAIPDANRRGVLTQGAIMLAVGGGESYTHPVQRGRWVMANLLCAAPGSPPPGVPPLDTTNTADLPIRDRLAAHVASPACNGCHVTMDVYGLGLENFDLQGKWRTTYPELNNLTIDASGALPSDGGTFTQPAGMIDLLAKNDAVKTCLAQKVMVYALARPLAGTDDLCTAQVLGQKYAQSDSKLSELFGHMTQSPQFLMQQGAAQ